MEIDEGHMVLGLKAAGMRIPYIPTRVGLGTDVLKHNSSIRLIESPYDGKEWVAMPAINLDVALLHVDRADSRGVCQIAGPDIYMDDLFARAATNTFVSCDELVESSNFDSSKPRAWCSGSALKPRVSCICPAVLTHRLVLLCMALMSSTSRNTRPAARKRAAGAATSRNTCSARSRNIWKKWVA